MTMYEQLVGNMPPMTELDRWKNEARELNAEIERLNKALDRADVMATVLGDHAECFLADHHHGHPSYIQMQEVLAAYLKEKEKQG